MSEAAKQKVLERFPIATCEFLPDTMLGIWPNDGSDVKGCLGVGNYEEEAWESAYRNAGDAPPAPQGSGEHKLVAKPVAIETCSTATSL